MPSTHLSLHYHVIFSTHRRQPSIAPGWRDELHRYLAGCIKTTGGVPVEIGGVADHVHLLFGLRATRSLADVMRDIKSASSKWVHDEQHHSLFAWQEGYGAFTVGRRDVDLLRRYVRDQAEHHRRQTFQDEYVALLNEHDVEFVHRYLW
jgi:putative transposase